MKTQSELVEAAIEKHMEFLNGWHKFNDEIDMVITRASYDEYDDPPEVLMDWTKTYSGGEDDMRMIVIKVNPYHDEGGPSVLTAFYKFWDPEFYGWRDEEGKENGWVLEDVVYEFDTLRGFCFQGGKVVGPS